MYLNYLHMQQSEYKMDAFNLSLGINSNSTSYIKNHLLIIFLELPNLKNVEKSLELTVYNSK